MDDIELENKKSLLQTLVNSGNTEELTAALEDFPTALVVEFLEEQGDPEIIHFLN